MNTKNLIPILVSIGLMVGSCSTSQKHVAFQSGGWKETVDPRSVRTHINNEIKLATTSQATTNNTILPSSIKVDNKIETYNAKSIDETKINLQELAPQNNIIIKNTVVNREAKKLNFAQRILIKPLQKKADYIVKKTQEINRYRSSGGYGFAISSLVLGILGILGLLSTSPTIIVLGLFFGLFALILGIIGIGTDAEGKVMSIIGIILGSITTVTALFYLMILSIFGFF